MELISDRMFFVQLKVFFYVQRLENLNVFNPNTGITKDKMRNRTPGE